MSCSTYAILQRKKENGKWETILDDVFQFCSSESRDFASKLEGHATHGLPKPFRLRKYEYLGDWGYCHITLDRFALLPLDKTEPTRFSVEVDEELGGVNIHIPEIVDEGYGVSPILDHLQQAFSCMFDKLENYRLVIGFN